MVIDGLAEIVGRPHVSDRPETLREFASDGSSAEPVIPGCIVRPADADEIQRIVRWANQTRTPLVPVSSDGPHARGDTVPEVPNAVILDLSRMNNIVRIDTRNKLVMIEPGVTFGDLQEALAQEGLAPYLPLAPRRTKSVIGSVLEREPITWPAHHWDATDPLLCAEIIFGTGDRFRTGEASGPDSVEKQWEMGKVQLNPFGHSHVDFQRLISGAQGTIGIVTWATLKCASLSQQSRALFVPSADLGALIDLIYQPLKFRLGGRLFILNGMEFACLSGASPGGIPPWVLFISFEGYGVLPDEKLAYEESDFSTMAASGGLKPQATLGSVSAQDFNQVVSQPSPEPYWKVARRGAYRDVFFLTTLDNAPRFATAFAELATKYNFPQENIGIYFQPVVQGTSCHCEFTLFYDPASSSDAEAVNKIVGVAGESLSKMGAFFSRPYHDWRNAAYAGAPATAAMQRKVKAIFDPAGILNPGKLCF